jgi:hypothetical protein
VMSAMTSGSESAGGVACGSFATGAEPTADQAMCPVPRKRKFPKAPAAPAAQLELLERHLEV